MSTALDIIHSTMQDESFLNQLRTDPATTLDPYDLDEEAFDALASRDEDAIKEEIGLIQTDILVAIAVTVVVT